MTKKSEKNSKVKKENIEELESFKTSIFNSKSLGANFFVSLIMFIVCLVISVAALVMAIRFEEERTVAYQEKGTINYELCYKDDEFYHGRCFNSTTNMRFIASLIDNIKLHYRYDFSIDEKETIDYKYNIIAKLSINDATTDKVFYEKEYKIIENKELKMVQDTRATIDEDIEINYGEYNALANQFNSMYGMNTNNKLSVYMTVQKSSDTESLSKINNTTLAYATIPLSEKAVDIDINTKDFENHSSILKKVNVKIKNILFGVVFLVFTFLTVMYVIKIVRYLIKLFPAKTPFEKYINRILKEYDRLIGETKNAISFEDKEIIRFEKFSELLDVHDNLNLPIMYYNVVLHKEAYFYILKDNIVYLHDVKASALDK